MDDLIVDDEFTTAVIDDEGTDRATAIAESALDLREEAVVVNDRETLLDVAGLSHANQQTVVADIEDAVLLEDGAEHALDIDGWLRVGVEGGFFLQLLGEEVDAQVAVLAGLRGQADANDLAGTALEDDQVADADEVAGDGDGVEARHGAAGLDEADLVASSVSGSGWAGDFFGCLGSAVVDYFGCVVVVAVVEGVQEAVGGAFNTTAEAVVVAFVVVVAHITLVLVELNALFNLHFGCWSTTLVFDVVGVGGAAVVSLSIVDTVAKLAVVGLAAIDVDVNLGVSVRAGRTSVSVGWLLVSVVIILGKTLRTPLC
jgi:hypothetical protein